MTASCDGNEAIRSKTREGVLKDMFKYSKPKRHEWKNAVVYLETKVLWSYHRDKQSQIKSVSKLCCDNEDRTSKSTAEICALVRADMPLSEYYSTYPVAISEKHSWRQMQCVSVQSIYRHHLVESQSSDDKMYLRIMAATKVCAILIRIYYDDYYNNLFI